MRIKGNKRVLIVLTAVFVLSILIYGKIINLFFSQDDFFHLRVSRTDGSFLEFLKLGFFRSFEARGGIYFYRPIFREFLFNIYYSLFGLNSSPFRITQFLLHFINICLVYGTVKKITGGKKTAVWSAFFFGITASQIGILSYLAGGIQVAGGLMFYLLSILFFIKYLELKKLRYFLITAGLYCLAISSHELAISLPFILIAVYLVKFGFEGGLLVKAIKLNIPLFLIALSYLLFEIKIIGLPTGEAAYSFNFSPVKLLNSYAWYFHWALGIPEMLLDFVGPGIKLNPNLMKYWGSYYKIIFPAFAILILSFAIAFKKMYKSKSFLFFCFWFLVGLGPVIFQPGHRQYYYLGIALPGMAGLFGMAVENLRKNKLAKSVLILSFLILTLVSVNLSFKTYWSISRSNLAQSLISDVLNKYPTLPKGGSVYFRNDPNSPYINEQWGNSSKQASVILSGSDALQLVYHDPKLKVYYQDLEEPPMGEKVYSLNAIIYPSR